MSCSFIFISCYGVIHSSLELLVTGAIIMIAVLSCLLPTFVSVKSSLTLRPLHVLPKIYIANSVHLILKSFFSGRNFLYNRGKKIVRVALWNLALRSVRTRKLF